MFRFPWGDMHSLNLGWFLQKFNELREDWATAEAGIDGALDAEIEKAEDALSDVFAARDAAAASATAAAGSASAAGTSATAAQNSATAAGNSATLANNKATAAGLSEAAAAQSATQAGNSATAAAGSATQAGQSATNAAESATAAAASETNAAGSATAAAGSATAADGSASAAEASAQRAEQVEQSIPSDYTELSEKVDALEENLPLAAGVVPFNLISLYKTYSVERTQTGSQYITTLNNKIIVEKENNDSIGWFDVHFMLPSLQPSPPSSFDSIIAANINNFQNRAFTKIRALALHTVHINLSYYAISFMISIVNNGEIVSRQANLNLANGIAQEVPLNAQEIAAEKINITCRIRSNNSDPINNAAIVIDFINGNDTVLNANRTLGLTLENDTIAETEELKEVKTGTEEVKETV